ncbi:hypothetical protein VTN00DRAFT_7116 [Thermoascus crustaceus]|uniref:uncharacterized protein n=1 Tax=Thermoascus crustaceus TaxID=5088 RepID=UPI0037426C82
MSLILYIKADIASKNACSRRWVRTGLIHAYEYVRKLKRQFCYTLQSPNYPFGLGNKCDSLSREEILSYIPDQRTAESLVQKYLDTIERTYRLLHIPTFQDELARFWKSPAAVEDEWLAQLFMILALGFHASNTKLHSPISNNVDRTMLDRFFSGAEASLKKTSFMFIPTITTIRTLCIMVIAKQVVASSCHELDACGPLMATIVRLSMSIGIHCDPEDDSNMSRFDKEIRRRLWTTIAYMELQQAMSTGMPLLLRSSDFDTLPPANINDVDISPSSYAAPPLRRSDEYTDSSFQIILARSFPIAFDIVCLANSPSGTLEYDQVLQYNAEIKQLLYETALIFPNSTSASSNNENKHEYEWIDLQRTMLDVFFRRILLVLHLRYAQDPSASIIYPVSYWSSLECALALLVHQRHMCEEDPDQGADPNPNPTTTPIKQQQAHSHSHARTRIWFAELFKYDFFVAAVIVCIQLHRKDAPTLDETGQTTGPHGTGIQMPPRQIILQTLHCCREIWARKICRSHCHFFTHLTLGKLIRTLEAASSLSLGHDHDQDPRLSAGTGAEQVMQDSIRALEDCKCGSCVSGMGSVKRLFLNESVPVHQDRGRLG